MNVIKYISLQGFIALLFAFLLLISWKQESSATETRNKELANSLVDSIPRPPINIESEFRNYKTQVPEGIEEDWEDWKRYVPEEYQKYIKQGSSN